MLCCARVVGAQAGEKVSVCVPNIKKLWAELTLVNEKAAAAK
jgi:hypothetical protein